MGIFLMFVGLFFGMFIGICLADDVWHNKAVKHNKAEYYLDNNNNRQWRWKE